ncbi:MAG: protein kinase domain-containing protein [Terriglobales bacterium]
MTLTRGSRLGPFEIVSLLGTGGMGEVYRARDTRLEREVAIRVLPPAMTDDVEALRRMEHEVRAVAALNHPNLLSVHDIGRTGDGRPYIVSEQIEGQSLRQRLQEGRLPQMRAVEYGIQAARGLAAAHDHGVIHRDLNPDNIFITRDGRVKILDFGLAKLTHHLASDEVNAAGPGGGATQASMTMAGYMAPEQVRGQPADARSDIFSFGAVLYEMFSGRPAFRGDSLADTMGAILRDEPPELSTPSSATAAGLASVSAIPLTLDRIVRHCLEKEPAQRVQSAGDLAYTLNEFSHAGSTVTAGLSAPVGVRRRHWHWSATAAVAVIALAAAAAAWFARGRMPPPLPELSPLTYRLALISGAALLPGQRLFVVSARFSGTADERLYVGLIGAPGLLALDASRQEVAAISKNGELLLLAQGPMYAREGAGTLSEMPLTGGAPRAIMRNIGAACWTPDGASFAVVRLDPSTGIETLEYPAGHALYKTSGWISAPRFSPDGREIAFLDHPVPGDSRGRAALVDLAGHERGLSPIYGDSSGLAWSPAGNEVWFSAGLPSWDELYAAKLNGQVRPLYDASGGLTLEDALPDGRVLLASGSVRSAVFVVSAAAPAGRDLSILSYSQGGVLSPDSKQALVQEDAAGSDYAEYLRGTDGAPPVHLGPGDALSLSPDGQWALGMLPNHDDQLELMPTGVGEPRQLTHSQVLFAYPDVSFLPDSRGIVAAGNLPGHDLRVWRVGLDGRVAPLTPEGYVGYLPTPDGQFVLVHDSHRQWFLYPLQPGKPAPVSAMKPGDFPIGFGATDDQLFVTANPDLFDAITAPILRLDLRTGARQPLATVAPTDPGLVGVRAAYITPDGKTYTYNVISDASILYLARGLH